MASAAALFSRFVPFRDHFRSSDGNGVKTIAAIVKQCVMRAAKHVSSGLSVPFIRSVPLVAAYEHRKPSGRAAAMKDKRESLDREIAERSLCRMSCGRRRRQQQR